MHLHIIGRSDAGIEAGLRAGERASEVEVTLLVADRYPNSSSAAAPSWTPPGPTCGWGTAPRGWTWPPTGGVNRCGQDIPTVRLRPAGGGHRRAAGTPADPQAGPAGPAARPCPARVTSRGDFPAVHRYAPRRKCKERKGSARGRTHR